MRRAPGLHYRYVSATTQVGEATGLTTADPIIGLGLALGIGLMIGIERGWQLREAPAGTRVAGVRTYAMLGLLGGIVGVLADGRLFWIAVLAAGAIVGTLVLGYRAMLQTFPENVSATGSLVAVLTFLLGVLATTGHPVPAVAIAGAATFLLSMRDQLHGWLRSLGERDVRAAAQYIVIACVILPLLPDRYFGPYNAWNPRNLWLVVVFVTGLSFAGYWASKRLGPARGTVIAAAIGATYSSTAVSAELARRLRDGSENAEVLRAGIAAATAVMPLRVLVLVAILVPAAWQSFALGMATAVLFSTGYALFAGWRADRGNAKPMPARNPFDFWPAIGFAALVAGVVLLSHWALERFGDRGVTTLVGLTGLYDVDAAIITVGNLPSGGHDPRWLGFVLLLPVLINTLWKAVVVVALGGWSQGLRAAVPLIGSALLLGGGLVALRQPV